MHGTAAPGELTATRARPDGGVHFAVATPADDAALRRLARDNPMRGEITLSLEREPAYFSAADIEGPEHQTIIATENGRLICAGSVSTRLRFINGRPTRVGYLGGLRLDASARNRASVIRRGYELFHRLHDQQSGPQIYLTSIVADNLPALRLLERGLPGMPTYRYLGEFVTLVIPRRRFAAATERPPTPDTVLTTVVDLLNRNQHLYQFAPVWTIDDLQSPARCPGLRSEDFCLDFSPDGTPTACAALWDQRRVKQTVVRGYAPALRTLRPLINPAARLLGRPRLPAIGESISHAFVSHFVTDPQRPQSAELLIHLLRDSARTRRIDYVTIGFDARDPRLAHLRRAFAAREYLSRLYAVHWDDGADLARRLDGRLLAPEVALL